MNKNTQCSICGRILNCPSDPLSGDCGGDCWGCIGEIEARSGWEPSLSMVRQEFSSGLRPEWEEPQEKKASSIELLISNGGVTVDDITRCADECGLTFIVSGYPTGYIRNKLSRIDSASRMDSEYGLPYGQIIEVIAHSPADADEFVKLVVMGNYRLDLCFYSNCRHHAEAIMKRLSYGSSLTILNSAQQDD